ncbi:MAG: hypothetical protein M3N98_14825 [Actinomycetota bacterium]|nr:hypothetical protein [Actinomycetota bacterium]
MAIIDGGQWRRERQGHLRAELEKDLSDDQRTAIETELATLEAEAGRDRHHWWRWFLTGARPPG